MSEPKGKGTRIDEPLSLTCPVFVSESEVVTVHQRLAEIERKLDHIFALLVTNKECPLCPGFSDPCGNSNCPQLSQANSNGVRNDG